MKKIIYIFTLFFSLIITGCVTGNPATEPNFNIPPKDAAKIYVIRPAGAFTGLYTAPIYINQYYAGTVGQKGYLTWTVRAGQVLITTSEGLGSMSLSSDVKHHVDFQAEAGKTYYVKVYVPVQMAMAAPNFGMELLNETDGKNLLADVGGK